MMAAPIEFLHSDIVITGMGLAMACGSGVASAARSWHGASPCFAPLRGDLVEPMVCKGIHGAVSENFSTAGIIPPMVNRRLDRATRLAWVAAKESFDASGLDPAAFGEALGIAVGTTSGGNEASEAFMLPYLKKGPEAASPMLFPNCVAISISGNLSTAFKFKGPSVTHLGRENSTLAAMEQGMRWLRMGMADAVLAIGTDSLHPLLLDILWHSHLISRHSLPVIGSRQGCLPGEGAQAFILERRPDAERREARILGLIRAMGHRSALESTRTSCALALKQAVEQAMAALAPSENEGLQAWIGGSNGHRMLDEVEAPLIASHPAWPSPRFPKILWGEFCGSGGQLLAAALLDEASRVLITAPASSGSQMAMLIEKP